MIPIPSERCGPGQFKHTNGKKAHISAKSIQNIKILNYYINLLPFYST